MCTIIAPSDRVMHLSVADGRAQNSYLEHREGRGALDEVPDRVITLQRMEAPWM